MRSKIKTYFLFENIFASFQYFLMIFAFLWLFSLLLEKYLIGAGARFII